MALVDAAPSREEGRLLGHSIIPTLRSLTTRQRVVVTLFYCVVFPYYWWTAVSSGPSGIPDYYNQLTDSFLAGHLDMLYQPPKGLLRLANPYLSSENGAYQHQYHDLILWHGHFYIGWGVTPVVTLFLPWRALGVGDMPVSLAAVIFACVGLFFAVLLFLTLLDRFLPGTSLWTVAVALAALALCSVVPFMLRRPAVYEVEIISGYAFLMLALYLLASGCLRSRLVAWRLGLGSLCLGLAFGARAVLIPVTLLAAALVFVVVLHDTANRRTKQVLSYGSLIFVPLGVVLLLALAYNYARFGSPFQYGNEYSLGGVYTRNLHLFSLRYLRPGLTYMVFKPIYFTLSFPYVGLTNFPLPASLPAGYSIEAIGGFLDTTPFVVLLGGIAFVGLRDRMSREFRAVLLALTALGVLGLLTVAFAIWDVTQEYEADYLSLLLIPALLVWSALRGGRGWGRRVMKAFGAVLIVYSCAIGFALSFSGYYDSLLVNNPGTFWTLERYTSFLPTTVTKLLGHPDLVRVYYVGGGGTYQPTLRETGVSRLPLHVDVVAPDSSWQMKLVLEAGLPTERAVHVTVRNGDVIRHVTVGAYPSAVLVPLAGGVDRIRITVADRELALIKGSSFVREG